MKTCSFTGHRPKGFLWNYFDKDCPPHQKYLAALRKIVVELAQNGIEKFICGGALGADQDFAEIVLEVRQTSNIQLEIAMPCPNQDLKWNDRDKERYRNILRRADTVSLISEHYTTFCMQARNRYMVDKSDVVIAVWNMSNIGGTFNTIEYAKKKNKEIKYIIMQDLL